MKNSITTTIKLLLAAALVVAAYQYRAAYRAEQARLLADALAFAHWHGERGHDIATMRAAWAKFENDVK